MFKAKKPTQPQPHCSERGYRGTKQSGRMFHLAGTIQKVRKRTKSSYFLLNSQRRLKCQPAKPSDYSLQFYVTEKSSLEGKTAQKSAEDCLVLGSLRLQKKTVFCEAVLLGFVCVRVYHSVGLNLVTCPHQQDLIWRPFNSVTPQL